LEKPRSWAHGPPTGLIEGRVLTTLTGKIAPIDHSAPIARTLAIGRCKRTHEMRRLSGIATGAAMIGGIVTPVAMIRTAGATHGTTEAVVTIGTIHEITPMTDRLRASDLVVAVAQIDLRSDR